MYDLQRRRVGVSFPTHGPASVAGICRVFDIAFALADLRVGFLATERKKGEQATVSPMENVEIGPLIANINLPEGPVGDGELLASVVINKRTGEVKVEGPRDDST